MVVLTTLVRWKLDEFFCIVVKDDLLGYISNNTAEKSILRIGFYFSLTEILSLDKNKRQSGLIASIMNCENNYKNNNKRETEHNMGEL